MTQKTGEFHLRVEVGPDALEGEKGYQWVDLLHKMVHRVSISCRPGREYELAAKLGKWEPADAPFYEKLQMDFSLVLLDALTAEVGEWARDLPYRVPRWRKTVVLGEGHGEATGRLFQRGNLGWQRVE